jgi:hypothetical protein
MLNHRKIIAPTCTKCDEAMVWKSEQTVDRNLMQVFQCKTCEKMEAVLLPSGFSSSDVAHPPTARDRHRRR